MNKLTIIILTWNGLDLTKKCIESLKLKSLPKEVDVVVVDNASTDGTQAYIESISRITLVKNATNLGFGKAINRAIQNLRPDSDILLLNNDAQILTINWLDYFIEHTQDHPEHGIIGTRILKNEQQLQHCGAYLPIDTLWGQQLGAHEFDINQYFGIWEVEGIVFACAYIRHEVLQTIGLLDEDFFAYFEDTDFCLRAQAAGFKIAVNNFIRVLHFENSSTLINRVSHANLFKKSQLTFQKKWLPALKQKRYPHGQIDFHSIINFPSGYAGSAKAYIEELDRQGIEVAYQYIYGPNTVFPRPEPPHSDSYIANLARSRPFGKAPIQIAYSQGDVFERNTGRIKVGFTMLEVDGLPDEWVHQANTMDEVWVPSHFNVKTFRNAGVMAPIHVIPLGIDPAYFAPTIQGFKNPRRFTFLSIFEWGERKAPEILLRAFRDEFKDAEDVALICKVNNFDASIDLKQLIRELNLRPNGGKIVIAENRILHRYELACLYRSVDCFVLPTRGEGWGMPILEAMASGLPVIATDWSSQCDFMTPQNSLPLSIDGLIPAIAKCPYYEGFSWANPSYEHLRVLMRWVFEHPNEAQAIGQQAAMDAKEKWTWKQATQKMVERLNELG